MKNTNESLQGYTSRKYGVQTKRYCQTLSLRDDPGLISLNIVVSMLISGVRLLMVSVV
jgi:hypothetical protein